MLNPLCQFDLALAREQRNHTHLAKIDTDGIVALVESAGRDI